MKPGPGTPNRALPPSPPPHYEFATTHPTIKSHLPSATKMPSSTDPTYTSFNVPSPAPSPNSSKGSRWKSIFNFTNNAATVPRPHGAKVTRPPHGDKFFLRRQSNLVIASVILLGPPERPYGRLIPGYFGYNAVWEHGEKR